MVDEKLSEAELQEMVEQKTAAMYGNVESVQEKLGTVEVEGKSDKDLVKIILTGQHEMKSLSINPELLKESNKTVEEAVFAAYKDAKIKVEEQVKLKMVDIAKLMGFFDEPNAE